MRELRKAGFTLCVGMFLFVLTGFGPKRGTTPSSGGETDAMMRHVAMLRSGKAQQKAAAAQKAGIFAEEIVSVNVPGAKGAVKSVVEDEHIRPETTLEKLAKLPSSAVSKT